MKPVLLGLLLLSALSGAAAAPPILDVLKANGLQGDVCAAFEYEDTLEPAFTAPGFTLTPKADAPCFLDGRSGKGLLIEEGATNLLTVSTSGQEEQAADFTPLRGATLALETADPAVGKSCVKVAAPGKTVGEGFYVSTGNIAAGTVVSGGIRLRGEGKLCLRLFDMTNYLPGAPAYVTLTPAWQEYAIPAISCETAGSTDLRLLVETATAAATVFYADALQLTPREYITSWTPGSTTRPARQAVYTLTGDGWKLPEGTMLLWVNLRWDMSMTLPGGIGRAFLAAQNGEPSLYWTLYNSLGTVPFNGYPRVKGADPFAGGWQFLAVAWSPTQTLLCHNTQCQATPKGASLEKTREITLGPLANAVYDQWVILKRALTKEELLAIYQATK